MSEKQSKWWNNGKINKRSFDSPGKDFVLGRLNYKRKPHSKETIEKISNSLTGNIPWNKGKTGIYSEETLKKMSLAKENFIPWNKNKITEISPWNKGLTKESDDRIKIYSEKQKGQKRKGNYSSPDKWKGEENPWFGKNRSKENHPRYKGETYNREYKDYCNKVMWLTEKTYIENLSEINPNNYPRTLCGVDGGYQLDHIYSIKKGFDNKIPAEEISKKENLQMLSWKENREKWSK